MQLTLYLKTIYNMYIEKTVFYIQNIKERRQSRLNLATRVN